MDILHHQEIKHFYQLTVFRNRASLTMHNARDHYNQIKVKLFFNIFDNAAFEFSVKNAQLFLHFFVKNKLTYFNFHISFLGMFNGE